MEKQKVCVSCRLKNKSVCYSTSPDSQYCSDFTLFYPTMAPTNNDTREVSSGMDMRTDPAKLVFRGNNFPDEDLEADFEAIANDSGYFSSQSTPKKFSSSTAGTTENSLAGLETAISSSSNSSSAAASVEAVYGSVRDMVDIADVKRRVTRRVREDELIDESLPSLFDASITTLSPLETWKQTSHAFEELAYRLEQPAKRRKTTRS